jgi:BTB/POZ domain/Leucine rich repeat
MNIECSFDLNSWGYGSIVRSANITEPETEIESFIGEHHEEEKTDVDVNSIRFEKTIVKFFPQSISKHFTNLKKLHLVFCGLKKICKEDLNGLNLKTLILTGNELVTLPDNLFESMQNLETLGFMLNNLESLTSKLLQSLHKLKFIDFRKNTKINAFYESRPNQTGATRTVKDLMNIIDSQCDIPIDIELWTGGIASDVLVVVGTKEYRVHKTVLAAKSELFQNSFKKLKNTKEWRFPDYSTKAFECFLQFAYGINNNGTPFDLLKIADQFEAPELKSNCEEEIAHQINAANALDILNLAHRFNSIPLQDAASKFIEKIKPGQELPYKYKHDIDDLKVTVDDGSSRKRKIKKEFDGENIKKSK